MEIGKRKSDLNLFTCLKAVFFVILKRQLKDLSRMRLDLRSGETGATSDIRRRFLSTLGMTLIDLAFARDSACLKASFAIRIACLKANFSYLTSLKIVFNSTYSSLVPSFHSTLTLTVLGAIIGGGGGTDDGTSITIRPPPPPLI